MYRSLCPCHSKKKKTSGRMEFFYRSTSSTQKKNGREGVFFIHRFASSIKKKKDRLGQGQDESFFYIETAGKGTKGPLRPQL